MFWAVSRFGRFGFLEGPAGNPVFSGGDGGARIVLSVGNDKI